MTVVKENREPIYCDCCGNEVMAYRDGHKIVIRQRRHGRDHWVAIDIYRLVNSEKDLVEYRLGS